LVDKKLKTAGKTNYKKSLTRPKDEWLPNITYQRLEKGRTRCPMINIPEAKKKEATTKKNPTRTWKPIPCAHCKKTASNNRLQKKKSFQVRQCYIKMPRDMILKKEGEPNYVFPKYAKQSYRRRETSRSSKRGKTRINQNI